MERSVPVRKPHTSTADLLTWPEAPPADPPAADSGSRRPHQVGPRPAGNAGVLP